MIVTVEYPENLDVTVETITLLEGSGDEDSGKPEDPQSVVSLNGHAASALFLLIETGYEYRRSFLTFWRQNTVKKLHILVFMPKKEIIDYKL